LQGAGLLVSPLMGCTMTLLLIMVGSAHGDRIGLAAARKVAAIRSAKARRNRFTTIVADT
jgi:hypothetical protein